MTTTVINEVIDRHELTLDNSLCSLVPFAKDILYYGGIGCMPCYMEIGQMNHITCLITRLAEAFWLIDTS